MLRFAMMIVPIVFLIAAPVAFADDVDTKSGALQLAQGSTKVSVGKGLKLEAEFKKIELGKTSAVSVGGTLSNVPDHKIFYAYHVALFDKEKNLVGCQSYTLWVDPGKKDARAGTFIALPEDQIAKIASYSIVFYESEKQIGSK